MFILLPVKTSRLSYRVVDPLLPRNPPVGIDASMCFGHLLMIHQGLPYPKVRHVMPYYLLRCFMRPYVVPQVLHGLILISLTRAYARPRLCHRGGAQRHNQTEN